MKEIETERLILRNFTESDFEDLFEYISDPAVTEYEPYKPMNKQEARDNLTWRLLEPMGFTREAHFKENVYLFMHY